MPRFKQLPKFFYRLIKLPPQVVYAVGLGPIVGRLVLLLTTTGRVSGLPRVTPLQYEKMDDILYVGAARGMKSDWVRNILAEPHVEVRLKSDYFKGIAEVITSPEKIADFLELRLKNHPRMVMAMLKSNGISTKPTREELLRYAEGTALVAIHPIPIDVQANTRDSR
jgi:deazaflavin-dependent oxidoreductase (nitroreductase family)